jgi:hypothetical protein
VSPDDPEVRAFLNRARVAQVATRSLSGAPFVTPLWFVARGERLCSTTSEASITVRNLEADGTAALLLYDGADDGVTRVLRLHGRATVRRGRLPLVILARMAAKYYAAPAGLRCELSHARLWRLRSRYYAQGRPALIEFVAASAEFLPRPA